MEYRRLGRTDLTVSAICLGTMTWGEQNTEAEGHAQMDMAVDRGVNFFDTAELYAIPPRAETQGATEEIIGSWFDKSGKRDEIVLATKVTGRSGMTWFRDDGSPTELTPAQMREALEKSLKRLRTDHIDLYQLHWPDRDVSTFGSNPTVYGHDPDGHPGRPIEETLETLQTFIREGKVRHVGLSNESAWGTMRFLNEAETRGLPRMQSIQNAYSLVNRTFEVGLAETAMREDIGLLAYSALAQGYLTGKYRDGARPPGARKTLFERLQRYEKPGAETAYNAYLDLAAELDLDPAQMALKFALTRPFMTSVIIGATNLDQLATNIDAETITWSEDLEDRINAIHQVHQNPCP